MNVRNGWGSILIENKKEKSIYGIAFFLCAGTMLLCMLAAGVVFGPFSILESDLSGTYVPALRAFAGSILSGEDLTFAWNNCLGTNTTAYYAYYVGCSITNLLYIVFFKADPQIITVLAILIKTGLTGSAFAFFMRRFSGNQRDRILLFSLFYAMSSYQVYINSINTIWMDAAYMLPLILGLIIVFVEEGKWRGLVPGYVYLFCTNFYMAYMVGIFSAIFFLLYLWNKQGKKVEINKNIIMMLRYGAVVLLSIGISAVVLLPAGIFIFTQSAADSTDTLTLNAGIWQIYNQLFLGQNKSLMDQLPAVYTGVPVLLLVPAYFVNKHKEKNTKRVLGCLLLVLLFSYLVPLLYLFWHGFDVPDGWPYRFSGIFSFLLCVTACLGTEETDRNKPFILYIFAGINFLIYLGIFIFQKVCIQGEVTNSWTGLLLNGTFLIFWSLLLSLHQEGKKQGRLALAFAVVEVLVNGSFLFQVHERPLKSVYDSWYQTGVAAEDTLQEDNDLYRVYIERDKQFNTDMFFGFNGIGDFGTMENYKVRKALSSLGIYTSPRVQHSAGLTPFTQLILGIKYYIPDMYREPVMENERVVLPYDRYFGMGFMVSEDIINYSAVNENVYENINALASAMLKERIEIFCEIPKEKLQMESKGITYGCYEDGKQFFYGDSQQDGLQYFIIKAPENGQETYLTVDCGESVILFEDPFFIENTTNFQKDAIYDYKRLGVKHAHKMESVNGEKMAVIGMMKGLSGHYMEFQNMWVYALDEDKLNDFYQKLKGKQFEIMEHQNGYVKGSVLVENRKEILYTSIPYDSGWKVTSSQGEVEVVPLLSGAFTGIVFPTEGIYELEFQYEAPGSKWGAGISVISLLIFVGIYLSRFISRANRFQ